MFGKLIAAALRLLRFGRGPIVEPKLDGARVALSPADGKAYTRGRRRPPPAPHDEGRRAAIERGVWAATPPGSGISVRLVSARPEAAAMSEMMGGSVAVSIRGQYDGRHGGAARTRAEAGRAVLVGRMTFPGARMDGMPIAVWRSLAVSVVRPLPADAAGDAALAEGLAAALRGLAADVARGRVG